MNTEQLSEILLKQETRGFDRYLLAPFLIYVGVKYNKLPKQIRRILVAAGIYQFFYAYRDYQNLQKKASVFIKNYSEC